MSILRKALLLIAVISVSGAGTAFSAVQQQAALNPDEAQKLLSRLDLSKPGLEKVKEAANDPVRAASELLKYYRSRTGVKHPVDRLQKSEMPGKAASAGEIKMADDALKHIFVGQSAYPPVFCGDDIDWGKRPVPDNEWVWQLNRMYFWDAMARAYWHTGDEKYAREWCYQLVDWTRKNPNDKDHAYAWRSIETGIRGYNWTGLFQWFLDSPSFTPEVLVAFLNSCYDHDTFLMTKYSKGSNWGLMEAEGLAFISVTFPEFKDADAWREEAFKRLNTEITNQVYSDGYQRELATGYHMGCIGWFTRTLELAKMNGIDGKFPDSYMKVVEKMCAVPMKLGFPDGSSTQFGDSWSGSPGQYYGKLREWAATFNRPDFLYAASEGKEGRMPDSTAYAFPKSGFYSMRSSWSKDAICLVLKCGPNGGGHCQPDNGTFELYAGGRHLMPDAGSYIYSGDPVNRNWFRQTKVHQTLTLNGANSAYAPKLLQWRPGKSLDVLVVENKSYDNLTHRRAVFFIDKKYFVIVDEAFGEATGNIDLHFQLAPGKAVLEKEKYSGRTDFADGWNVAVNAMVQDGMKMNEEEGQVSFRYTIKEPRPAFFYSIKKESAGKGVRFVTVVSPYSDTVPQVDVKLNGNPEPGSPSLSLAVKADGVSRFIGYNLEDWKSINTIEDVCTSYPDRMISLFNALDLNINGLKSAGAAYDEGNLPQACKLLLEYYKSSNSVQYLRMNKIPVTQNRIPAADSLLQDICTFYNQPAKVPHNPDGHLDWKYHGPTDDIEWAWALNRHYAISSLFDAYLKTGNTEYSAAVESRLKDWLISSLPYPGKKSSTELWRGLEVSFRVKLWARVFYALINDEVMTPATRLLMLSSIPDHAHYARNFHGQGNWLTMEISGLATDATAWPEFKDSRSWLDYSKETMTKSLVDQVYPDGVQTELTSSYHQVALNNFSLFAEICKKANEPLPDVFENYLEKMWNYQAYSIRPDGYGVLNNDADLIFNRDRIIRAAVGYGRKDWLYIASNGMEGSKPDGMLSVLFPYAGQLVTRSGYEPDAQWAFFDIGPWGTGHQHNDKLHISVYAYGRDLLVDGGRFSYRGEVADRFRGYATGSFSHNVILVDGKPQAPGPELVKEPLPDKFYKRTDEFDYASGSFDKFRGLEGTCSHTRSLMYVRGKFWVVVDHVMTDRPRKIEAMWHWNPDCIVRTDKNNIVTTDNPEGNLEIIPAGIQNWTIDQVKGKEKPVPQGWYSREYNSAEPSTSSIYSCDINGNATFIWILYPFKSGAPAIKAKITSQDEQGIGLRVKVTGFSEWDLAIPFSDSTGASVKKSK